MTLLVVVGLRNSSPDVLALVFLGFVVGAPVGWTSAVVTASWRSWHSNRRRWWTGDL